MRKLLAIFLLSASGTAAGETVVVHNSEELIQAVLNQADVIEVVGTITFESAFEDSGNALPLFDFADDSFTILRGRPGSQLVANQAGFRLASVARARLRLENLTIKGFSSPGDGGAIHANGDATLGNATLLVDDVTFYNNHATQQGGAVYAELTQVLVRNSTFENNVAGEQGGAFYLENSIVSSIKESQFTNNEASAGCAVYAPNEFIELNGNLFRGECPHAKLRTGSARLVQNSFVLCKGEAFASDSATLYGNLFTHREESAPGPLCRISGSVTSLGFNLAGDASCKLGAASDQTGFEVTEALSLFGLPVPAEGGAAIDAIEIPITSQDDVKCDLTDVTGLGRPQDGNGDGVFACDSGALEKQGGPDIGAAMTGAYFDPARNSEGYFVEMLDNGRAWVTFFTYAFSGDHPLWYFGVGDVVGNSIVVENFFSASGVKFGDAYKPEDFRQGTNSGVSLVFPNCQSQTNPGRAFFRSIIPFFNVPTVGDLFTKTVRLSQVVTCDGEPVNEQSGLSGSFYDPARAGEGIIVEWLDEAREAPVLAIWFTFDLEGNQLWIISDQATVNGDTVTLSMMYPAETTGFGPNFDPDEVKLEPWGTVTLDYSGCNEIDFSYESVVEGYGSGGYTYQRLTQPAGIACSM